MPQLISAKAAANPEALAASFGKSQMSYGELEQRAERLAGHLVLRGVCRDTPVAVCLERSFDSLVSALAIWKAGGTYLPLDPQAPLEHRSFVVRDAGAKILITRAPLACDADYAIDLDSDGAAVALAPPPPPCEVRREDLAYVIYTSGTTGEPKGVEVTHGNLLNFVFWSLRTWNITPADRSGHVLGSAFDAAIADLWPFLTAGASVELPEERVRTSPELLRDWIVQRRITMINVPSILAEPLIRASWPADTKLRWLTSGGDTLRCYPRRDLPFGVVNHYGPTECTVTATAAIVPPASDVEPASLPPIGKPIANANVYLLDQNMQPVAAGQTGEIYIGGTGVGRGYRNQPELTNQRFLEDPFSARPGSRMYRTGDLGAMLPDGQIVFRGRLDQQVKIRGHRIEPDGIAAVLGRHPQVRSCAVIPHGTGSERQLAAYVVVKGEPAPDSLELREFIGRTLPEYMIPSVFVRLSSLPATFNGKLDREALPAPDESNLLPPAAFEAPVSPIEAQVADVLSSMIHLPRVGRNDNFFLLGGHSLLAARLVLQIRDRFGVDLRMRQVMESQTVAVLAACIEDALLEKIGSLSDEEAELLLTRMEER